MSHTQQLIPTQSRASKFTIMVESAVGVSTYYADAWKWLDMQSTTYFMMEFADGSTMMVNDFSVRNVLIIPNSRKT